MRWARYCLIALGFLNMASHLLGLYWLRAAGEMTVASPLPLVFTDRDGMEDFASRYEIELVRGSGPSTPVALDSSHYDRLGGPFAYRSAYAEAIAYFPRLPEKLWRPVLTHGFCGQGPLARAAGLDRPQSEFMLKSITQTAGRDDVWQAGIRCPQP